MAYVDIDGDGVMDMETDATMTYAKSVLDLGTAVETTVSARAAEIDGIASGLGQGPLGREFAALYRPAAENIHRRTAWMHTEATYQGGAGTNSAETYLAYNEVSRQAIDSV
jgi:membrane-bound lytic murein transglycosylase B